MFQELTRTSSHETNEEFVSSLRIGQICCACFSMDQYWYRARVLDLIQEENEDSTFKSTCGNPLRSKYSEAHFNFLISSLLFY